MIAGDSPYAGSNAGKATGGQASQCASGSGRRPKKDLFLNAPNFPQGAAGIRWTPMRRQRQTAATTRPPRTWRATMARCRPFSRRVLSPLLSGQPGTRERKWRPCGAQCGGVTRNSVRVSNRFTGFRIENARMPVLKIRLLISESESRLRVGALAVYVLKDKFGQNRKNAAEIAPG